MKHLHHVVLALTASLFTLLALPVQAAFSIFATVPEWGALAQEIGGSLVTVHAATHALQDPHRIDARPSLILQARNAQLLIATGADLEIGWLPLVIRDSGNSRIQPGQPGYLEAASVVQRLEIPATLDRAHGDVHPAGNPHIQMDPRNLLKVAEALTQRLAQLDPANAASYQDNFRRFAGKWQTALARWEQQAAPLKGVSVWVQHKSFSYLFNWLGMKEAGTLEPKPGVEPTASHLATILARQQAQPARMVIRATYQGDHATQWLASRSKIRVVVLPFTVGGSAEAKDLTSLFDDTLNRLLQGLQ